MNRRAFVSGAAFTAASYARVYGANERINAGLIGCGKQGRLDWARFIEQPDVNPMAASEVYEPHLNHALTLAKGQARGFRDFRRMLELKDLDCVIVATPDHWHALQTVMACEAGKDVYTEKPLSYSIREGRVMVNAAREHKRIVQTGMQQRSGLHYARAVEIIRAGGIGKVSHISAGLVRNMMPGLGKPPDGPVPAGLDWDMWLGPAPKVPYNQARFDVHRYFKDYVGSWLLELGPHIVDLAHWAMNPGEPLAASASASAPAFAPEEHKARNYMCIQRRMKRPSGRWHRRSP
jgi:predicted dehydrogenase